MQLPIYSDGIIIHSIDKFRQSGSVFLVSFSTDEIEVPQLLLFQVGKFAETISENINTSGNLINHLPWSPDLDLLSGHLMEAIKSRRPDEDKALDMTLIEAVTHVKNRNHD